MDCATAAGGAESGSGGGLEKLRAILSTGSPLLPEHFQWIYEVRGGDVYRWSQARLAPMGEGAYSVACPLRYVHGGNFRRGEVRGEDRSCQTRTKLTGAGSRVVSERVGTFGLSLLNEAIAGTNCFPATREAVGHRSDTRTADKTETFTASNNFIVQPDQQDITLSRCCLKRMHPV